MKIKNEDQIKLINGDCFHEMKNISDNSIDLVLTDIPYNEVNRKTTGLRNLDKGIADSPFVDINDLTKHLIRICSGSIYIFCGIGQISQIYNNFIKNDLSVRLCVWEKTNPSPMNGEHIWLSGIECCVFGKKQGAVFNEFCKNTVWKFQTTNTGLIRKIHPTIKPLKLMNYIVSVSSNKEDVIFDPFMGSGTVGLVCKNLNRKFIGIEKDEKYFQVAKNRINKKLQKTYFDDSEKQRNKNQLF